MADALMSEAEVEELIERTRHALDAVAEVGVLARRADARGPAADVDEPRGAQREARGLEPRVVAAGDGAVVVPVRRVRLPRADRAAPEGPALPRRLGRSCSTSP